MWLLAEGEATDAGAEGLLSGCPALDKALSDDANSDLNQGNFMLNRGDGTACVAHCVIRRHALLGKTVYTCSIQVAVPCSPPARSNLRWGDILNGLPCLFYVIDKHMRLLLWNSHLVAAFETAESDMHQLDITEFFEAADRPALIEKIDAAFATGFSSHETVLVGRNGRRTPCLFQCAAALCGDEPCLFGTGVDISERIEQEHRLLVNERAMDACVNALIITKRNGDQNLIEYVNPAFSDITGYSRDECIGRDPAFMSARDMDPDERARIRQAVMRNESIHALVRNIHKNGTIFWNDLRISPIVDSQGNVTHSVAVVADVTEALRAEAQLRHLATHDQLTGLANRAMLLDSLRISIERARRSDTLLALIYLDLDNFKLINDTLGHAGGDHVLIAIAERLMNEVRAGDTVARLGGDEFIVILCNCEATDQVGEFVKRVHTSLTRSIAVSMKQVIPSVSIGVSLFPNDGDDATAILRSGDSAMYQAKTAGKNQYKFYSPEMDMAIQDYLERERSLRRGIEAGELFLNYQPKVDLKTGRVVGAEVLVRWNHPRDGVVMPNEFITLAEESGSIIQLGDWVLERACQVICSIRAAGYDTFTLSVNLSVRQLRRTDFVESVALLLEKYHVPHGSLELEVTESQLMDTPHEAAHTLDRLKRLGLLLSIDDFGTGYSSLSSLQKFPVDHIKIDKSFLGDLQGGGDSVIAQAIIALGHNLKMGVIAEGVETAAQLQFLRAHHCDMMQGHYFSPALSHICLLELLDSGIAMH